MSSSRLVILVVAVACCAAFVSAAPNDPWSRRYNVCKSSINTLLDKPAGKSRCNMALGLSQLATNVSLTTTQNVTYQTWITNMETTIIYNVSINATKDKLNMCAAEFKKFQSENPDIYTKIQYMNITTWGPVDNVCRITSEGNMAGSLELVVGYNVKGDCKLFDTLLAACSGDSMKTSALKAFIESDLRVIVKNKGKKEPKEIIKAINKALKEKFFKGPNGVQWMKEFAAYKLKGFFSFSQWMESADAYNKTDNVNATMMGSGMNCPFILSLNATLSSSNYSNTQKSFIKQIMDFFVQQFATETNITKRIQIVGMKMSESCDLSQGYFSLMAGIPIPGFGGGNFFDVIIIGDCQKDNIPKTCGCPMPTFAEEMTTTWMPSTSQCSCSCEM